MISLLTVDSISKLNLVVVGGHSDRNRSRSRIINKDKEPSNDYPWIAGVMKEYTMLNPDLTEARDLCTGSLISETYDYRFLSYTIEFRE